MSAYLFSLHTNALHQPQPQPPIQRDAQPKQSCSNSHNIRWNQANGWKQVLNNLRLVIQPSVILNLLQPLVESISDSTLISRIRVFSCTDESLPKSLALPRPTGRLPLFSRVTEERYTVFSCTYTTHEAEKPKSNGPSPTRLYP